MIQQQPTHIERRIDAPIGPEYITAPHRYIETDDAGALLASIEHAGLELSETAVNELTNERDSRYGNAYAWMTRRVAGWIGGHGFDLFESPHSDDEEPPYYEEYDAMFANEVPDLSGLLPSGSQGADLLIDLMRQTEAVKESNDTYSDIPVSPNTNGLRGSSCKDVEAYYVQAFSNFSQDDKLTKVSINEKQFWHKTHGADTFINLEPIAYSGVELPPGCVFRQNDDGGFLFLRVTGFAFDYRTAAQLFGKDMTMWYEAKREREKIINTFDEFARVRDSLVPTEQ